MKMWKYRNTDKYLQCNDSEDNSHILRSKITVASNTLDDAIQALESVLLDNQTLKNIVDMISGQLHLWRGNDTYLSNSKSPFLTSAILAQNIIGWQAFMEGYLSIE